jgi:hypothetical protein
MNSADFDQRFDAGESVLEALDLGGAHVAPKPSNLLPPRPSGQCVQRPIACVGGRVQFVCTNSGGAPMDDTPPRQAPEAR